MDRPASTWISSPNYGIVSSRNISVIVIHATATSGIKSPLHWLCSPESGVSAHYLIDCDGTIYNLVKEEDIAYHAGESEWGGKKWVNRFSVGIELVNPNDGISPYPLPQINACASLCLPICLERNISVNDVVGHADIAPGRKDDPRGFPWKSFRILLAAPGAPA